MVAKLSSWRGLAAFVIGLAVVAACQERTTPTSPPETVEGPGSGPFSIVGALTCTVEVAALTVSCERQTLSPGQLGPQFLIVGGQGVFVELVSSNVSYNSVDQIFYADVQVANRLGDGVGVGQQLGTPDETEVTGVRVFFHTGPNVSIGSGTVTVRNADGMATYTAADQLYHEYDTVLPPWFISTAKTWEWDVPTSVTQFVFEVYVEADVPHPNGFVQLDPEKVYLPSVGNTATLSSSIKDHVNRTVSGSVTYTSLDPSIATVHPTSGLVTAQAGGVVDIVASTGGPEDDGIARVTVARSGYTIDLRYLTSISASQKQVFEDSKARWESHLTADVPDGNLTSQGFPFCLGGPVNEYIDDLVINVLVVPIDGAGGVLGQAGPCIRRSTTLIPAFGVMQFDVADLNAIEAIGLLDETIIHEMGHVLGFGANWDNLSQLLGGGTSDPRYSGSNALAAYQALGGTGTTGVPVEGTGGSGTADGHWREDSCSTCETTDFFGVELMTGWISAGAPLSVVTIDQFVDLNYPGVDNTGADPFTLNTSLQALQETGPRIHLVDDIWRGPVYILNEDGTLTLAIPDRR